MSTTAVIITITTEYLFALQRQKRVKDGCFVCFQACHFLGFLNVRKNLAMVQGGSKSSSKI